MQRKIIHIDMDCFYAAIEIRDNPTLSSKAVAVGGSSDGRGVICTSNYIARQYGVRSAMSCAKALQLCPHLILLPVNFAKYKAAAQVIQKIFRQYTALVEPLSLDEAYLDVTQSSFCQGSATLIAQAIREKIWHELQLIASAGIAPNKFLAKIASGWRKPNGIFTITPNDVADFVAKLPVTELFGVGKATAFKLHQLKIMTCADLQGYELKFLLEKFGRFGWQLYNQARGQDDRPVVSNRQRKSLSTERTFRHDLLDIEACYIELQKLWEELQLRLSQPTVKQYKIKNQFIKIKYYDFKLVSTEMASGHEISMLMFKKLFNQLYDVRPAPVRLLGLGVTFEPEQPAVGKQCSLFDVLG